MLSALGALCSEGLGPLPVEWRAGRQRGGPCAGRRTAPSTGSATTRPRCCARSQCRRLARRARQLLGRERLPPRRASRAGSGGDARERSLPVSGPAVARATLDGAVWIGHCATGKRLPFQAAGDAACWPMRSRAARDRARQRRRLSRDPLRGARAASAICTFASTTAPWARTACERLLAAYRAGPDAADQGHRADGRAGLLVERHGPQADRGGAEPRR